MGSLLRTLGAVLALVSLFLAWYEPGASAWTAFELADAVLAVLAVLVLVDAAADFGAGPGLPRPVWPFAAGFLGLTALQLVNKPPAALDSGLEAGAWVALVAGVLMVLGVLLSRMAVTVNLDAADETEATRVRP